MKRNLILLLGTLTALFLAILGLNLQRVDEPQTQTSVDASLEMVGGINAVKNNTEYKYIPLGSSEIGQIEMGQLQVGQVGNTKEIFNVTVEQFPSSLLPSYEEGYYDIDYLRTRRDMLEPVYNIAQMKRILAGNILDESEIPVVLLDDTYSSKKQVVLFELTNLYGANPGVEARYTGCKKTWNEEYDNGEGKPKGRYEYKWVENEDLVEGSSNSVSLSKEVHAPVGKLGYNNTTLRAMFDQEGFYTFDITGLIMGKTPQSIHLRFSFYVVTKSNYVSNFPYLQFEYRNFGEYEIYNYLFDGEYPTFEYDPSRFEVNIYDEFGNLLKERYYNGGGEDKREDSMGSDCFTISVNDDGMKKVTFYKIGNYKIESRMIYNFGREREKLLMMPRFTGYIAELNVCGFQLYRGSGDKADDKSKFYDPRKRDNGPDITMKVNEIRAQNTNGSENLTAGSAEGFQDFLSRELDMWKENGFVVSKTNTPPVNIVGNVNYYFDGSGKMTSLVSYKARGADSWSISPLVIGKPFSAAGEYVLAIYSTYNNKINEQFFYFEINDIIDIQFVTSGRTYTFGEAVESGLSSNDVDVVFYGGLGSYQNVPETIISLDKDFDGVIDTPNVLHLKQESDYYDKDNNNKINLQALSGNGVYRITVKYGETNQASNVAAVVIDNTKATNLRAVSTSKERLVEDVGDTAGNYAIFGDGDVSFFWDEKISKVEYQHAEIDYYAFLNNGNIDNNASVNGDKFKNEGNLYSSSAIDYDGTMPSASYILKAVKSGAGWALEEVIRDSGIYDISIVDKAGNVTKFFLIIDDSKASFTQNKRSNAKISGVNSVPVSPAEPVFVRFGSKKLTTTLNETGAKDLLFDKIFEDEDLRPVIRWLRQKGVLSSAGRNAPDEDDNVDVFGVNIVMAGYSRDGNAFIYDNEFKELGYIRLDQEGSYVVQVKDALGNVSEYYIIISNDQSQTIIFSDSSFNDVSNGTFAPPSTASIITNRGGMTNRAYIYLSFFQERNINQKYYVDKVLVEYYPFTWDIGSVNYPFAESVGESAEYRSNWDNKVNYFDINEGRGLYIVTRYYKNGLPAGDLDENPRKLYFISDDNGMLYYSADQYQTGITVDFGRQKTADALSFYENKNYIESNLRATINGTVSKYRGREDINYLGYSFPSLEPRLTVTNAMADWAGRGDCYKELSVSLDNPDYRVLIADGAINYSYLQYGNVTEIIEDGAVTSANHGFLSLKLRGTGINADFYDKVGEEDVIRLNGEFENGTKTFIINPNRVKKIVFSFENSGKSFYADIDFRSVEFEVNVESGSISPNTDALQKYNYYLYKQNNGEQNSVVLKSIDRMLTTKFVILFDTEAPMVNLERIRSYDRVVSDDFPSDYVYLLPNDFEFSRSGIFEAESIKYTRLAQNLTPFVNDGATDIDFDTPFSEVVALQDDEVRYYMITETDLAGNSNIYYIQLKGKHYKEQIELTPPDNNLEDGFYFGIDMTVKSVDAVWNANPSFELFVDNDNWYRLIMGKAVWRIEGTEFGGSKSKQKFIEVIDIWLANARAMGKPLRFTFNDRLMERYFEVYQIDGWTPKIEIDSWQAGGNEVVLKVTNYNQLPELFFDLNERNQFKIRVDTITNDTRIELTEVILPNGRNTAIWSLTEMNNRFVNSYLGGKNNLYVGKNLLITIIDPFGRESVAEYHPNSGEGEKREIVFVGNTFNEDGATWTGAYDGIKIKFINTVYNVKIFDELGRTVSVEEWPSDNDAMTTYRLYPPPTSGVSKYTITFNGVISGSLVSSQVIYFDTRLAEIKFSSGNGNPIAENALKEPIAGNINMNINQLQDAKFKSSVSFIRTDDNGNVLERVGLSSKISNYRFSKGGHYVLTVMNEVWAEKVYEFDISSVESALIRVFDKGVETAASPVLEEYQGQMIKCFYITSSLEKVEIKTSANSDRKIIGDPEGPLPSGMYVYKYAFEGEESPIYFGIKIVTESPISVDSVNFNGFDRTSTFPSAISLDREDFEATGDFAVYMTGVINNGYDGNLLFAECYRNGKYIGRLWGDHLYGVDQIKIRETDGGIYEFYVYDLTGNTVSIGGKRVKWTIINLATPPILINGEAPINGMVYNGSVKVEVQDLSTYGFDVSADDYYLDTMIVNGEINENAGDVIFSAAGIYNIAVTYRVKGIPIAGNYNFQIVNSGTSLKEFSWNSADNMKIIDVTLDGFLVDENLHSIYYNAEGGTGLYTITVSIDGFIENDIKTFAVLIMTKEYSGTVTLSVGSGKTVSESVTMTYLRWPLQNSIIYVYKNDSIFEMKDLSKDTSVVDIGVITMSETGNYEVIVLGADGTVIFTDSFSITSAVGSTIWIVLGITAVVGGIIGIVFLRLRKNMRVK
ncbi:MAG: hypothetical protein LBH47_03360 [Christensenellaceae bacterium]|jgi:hypothetical protein|nr:hypothetical protein [Christensenellaceae bacterium]